jgi:hypothetical protein
MAVALQAIKGFLHLYVEDSAFHDRSSRRIVTILDVLEPRSPQA